MKKILFVIFTALLVFTGCKKETDVKTIKIPLVTWGGYAALFAANNGPEPKEDSLFYKYGNFKVELVQVEDPSLHLQGFSNGTYDIIWATMDMLPLQYEALATDPRSVPKVIGVFDYSAGGDGIVVRDGIRNASDMIGKKVVVPQYQPSHYFFLWYLNSNGIDPSQVNFVYAEDAIKAKDTYINDRSISVCVTWSPFIYDITDPTKNTYVEGSSLLLTTAIDTPAFGVIADVYLTNADFFNNNPEIIRAFTKAMLDGYDLYKADPDKVAGYIAEFFGIPGGIDEVKLMFGDVVIAGRTENGWFFDKNNPKSGYAIMESSLDLYKRDGKLDRNYSINPDDVIEPHFMNEFISQ